MITERIGSTTVKRLDDITELVCHNYNLFNEYALYDLEIGADLPAIQKHFAKVDAFFASGKLEDAYQARKSLDQCFQNIFAKNNFPALQWASLIHSIDGKLNEDLSLDNLKAIMEQLSKEGLTQAKILADVDFAKKKFALN